MLSYSLLMARQASSIFKRKDYYKSIASKIFFCFQGVFFARFFGEIACFMSTCLICLLLILLSYGWSFGNSSEILQYPKVVFIWGFLTSAHFVLFLINFVCFYRFPCVKIFCPEWNFLVFGNFSSNFILYFSKYHLLKNAVFRWWFVARNRYF